MLFLFSYMRTKYYNFSEGEKQKLHQRITLCVSNTPRKVGKNGKGMGDNKG
jgi:hypothetical protein